MELDPGPLISEAWTPFEPLIGRNLHVADAWAIPAPTGDGDLVPIADVVVGNPPWTFRGRTGTIERREHHAEEAPRSARGEALDFLRRSIAFSHEKTRFGVVLSASQFFSATGTTAADRHDLVAQLSPVTIVNLSALSDWLFETASAPAVVLFARCRETSPNVVTVVNVPWSPAGPSSHTFSISPSDISTIDLEQWGREPRLLKFAAYGRGVDAALMDRLQIRLMRLEDWLESSGTQLRDGLNPGSDRTSDARHLVGLPYLSGPIRPFSVPRDLPRFDRETAERPRSRDTYRAPILLVKETVLREFARPIAAVADRDLVFTDNYFGAALSDLDTARILAGIISSAFGAWYLLLTSADFGVSKRRLFKADIEGILVPNPAVVRESPEGRTLIDLVRQGQDAPLTSDDWIHLDSAVFDVLGLTPEDRIIVADGFERSTWQWKHQKLRSTRRPNEGEMTDYARVFISEMSQLLSAAGDRGIDAEVIDVRGAAINVLRFVISAGGQGKVNRIASSDSLNVVLERLGRRLGIQLGSTLVGERELRVYGDDEIVIIKPAERRHWMRSDAIADAGSVLADSFTAW